MRILRLIRTRPRAGRALAGVLAAGLLSVGQGPGPWGAAATSASVVVIYKTQWWENPFPAVHLIGQVRNDTGQAVTGITLALDLQDATGVSVGKETAYATLETLAPGEISPFEAIMIPPPAGFAKFAVAGVSFARSSATPNHATLPVQIVACQAPVPATNICGTVSNTGSVGVEGVHAALTLVNGSNIMVAQHYVIIDAPWTDILAPGHSGSFAIDPAGDPAYTAVLGTGEALYPLDLDPPSLDFGNQLVTTSSPSRTITVRNKGSRAIAIQAITPPTDFTATSQCPTSLGAGMSCSIGVVFTPSAMGARGGLLVISNDGAGSPDTVLLNGIGVAPIVQLVASGGTDFGPVDVGKSSPVKAISLTNVGTAPLVVTSIAMSGDFWRPQPNACVGTLAINASCIINVVFTPGFPGTRNGSLTLTDNALDSPQHLALIGFGVGSAVTFTPTSLNFGDADVVITDLQVTLINSGTSSLTITGVSTDGAFVASIPSRAFPFTLAPGGSCVINVTFLLNSVSANGPGLVAGLLTVNDSAGNHYVTLTANPASARGPVQVIGNPARGGAPGPPPPKS